MFSYKLKTHSIVAKRNELFLGTVLGTTVCRQREKRLKFGYKIEGVKCITSMAGPEIKKEWTKAQKRCNSVEACFFFPALLENFFTVVNYMYSASCESRKGSHSSVRRKSFMWERIWNRVKCLHEKESDTSLLKRQPEDLPSVMAKRLEWNRLIKSVRVRPK